jgi:hypothetical protein
MFPFEMLYFWLILVFNKTWLTLYFWVRIMLFNATFNNISAIPENYRPVDIQRWLTGTSKMHNVIFGLVTDLQCRLTSSNVLMVTLTCRHSGVPLSWLITWYNPVSFHMVSSITGKIDRFPKTVYALPIFWN